MNCKPGDLAVVVRSEGTGRAGLLSEMLLGRIVRVVRLRPPSNAFHCMADLVWSFEEPIRLELHGWTYIADGTADCCLRPIRDPGDDAVDESKAWLPPVPHEVKEMV